MENTTIEFTPEEIQLLLVGLGELPAKVSFNLLVKISKRLEEQKINKAKEPK